MSMKFDFRTKLLVIVLTMSLVAVLTSDILIYTLFGVLSVYLIIQGFGRQTIKYLIVCGIFIVLRLNGITASVPSINANTLCIYVLNSAKRPTKFQTSRFDV